MARYHFCAFNHDAVGRATLFDMFDWMRAGLEELGHEVSYSVDALEPGATNLVWEHFSRETACRLIESRMRYGIIVTEYIDGEGFNFGNPRIRAQSRRDPPALRRWEGFNLAAAHASFFWSMVESNLPFLRRLAPASFFELGYSDRLLPRLAIEPDLDFSFTGLMTPYRADMLARLSKRASVHWAEGLHAIEERARIILRTRINLSINKTSDWQMPSPTRIGRAVLACRGVAVERTPQRTRQSAMVPASAEGQDFVEFALSRLGADWRGDAARSLARYREEMPMRAIMERVLEESVALAAVAQPKQGILRSGQPGIF